MKIIDELKMRGMLNNISNFEKLAQLKPGMGVYIGFDPSAQSLHLGNYMQICVLKIFQKYGFKAFAVIGGATGMIGDPSGRKSERKLLDAATISNNKQKIKQQLEAFDLVVIDNTIFYQKLNLIDFLRDVGSLLNVNYMLNKESVKSRLEQGLSFTEFSYQLLQGWDFKRLYEDYQIRIQVGGADQWGNITAGLEIIRKSFGEEHQAVGITTNLMTDAKGNKIGKSSGGNALWLDANLTTPFHLYQFILNFPDNEVQQLLLWFSDLSQTKITKLMVQHQQKPQQRLAQQQLAATLLTALHGKIWLQSAQKISNLLFKQTGLELLVKADFLLLEKVLTTIKVHSHKRDSNIMELLLSNKIINSKREGREFIADAALKINNSVIKQATMTLAAIAPLATKYYLLQKGKKHYYLLKQ